MTTAVASKSIPAHSFTDESFDPAQCRHYTLRMLLGASGLQAAVIDETGTRFIAFESVDFQNAYSSAEIASLATETIQGSSLLKQRYGKVNCLLVNQQSTLVPQALFEERTKNKVLQLNTESEPGSLVLTDRVASADARVLFAVPSSLARALELLYPAVSFHHFSAALLEEIVSAGKSREEKQCYLHIQQQQFEIIVTAGRKLNFYNSFRYQSPEDVAYYLLFVCEQLEMNTDQMELHLCGQIDRNSAVFNLLYKYIRNIKFAARRDVLALGYQLQKQPRHFFYALLNSSGTK